MAKRYGDLIHEIWSGSAKTVAPLKLRVKCLFLSKILHKNITEWIFDNSKTTPETNKTLQ